MMNPLMKSGLVMLQNILLYDMLRRWGNNRLDEKDRLRSDRLQERKRAYSYFEIFGNEIPVLDVEALIKLKDTIRDKDKMDLAFLKSKTQERENVISRCIKQLRELKEGAMKTFKKTLAEDFDGSCQSCFLPHAHQRLMSVFPLVT